VAGPAQIGYAPDMVAALLQANLDCLHLHGLWMYPSRAGALWARQTRKPYLISPHGMLDRWVTSRSRLKKAVARFGYERDSWRRATMMHALTGREADDIHFETGRADSLVIPNAGPMALTCVQAPRAPHMLYIGRIHPKKNVVSLVKAWSQLDPQGGAQLTIAGWGDDASIADLQAALAAAPPSVEFVGSIFGEAKQRLLESARFTVLPSYCEGLPMSVLEGWAAGAPAIMSGECNLPEGFAAGAALDSGYGIDSISAALHRALNLNAAELSAMVQAALDLAAGPFSSDVITAQWAQSYRQMLMLDPQGK